MLLTGILVAKSSPANRRLNEPGDPSAFFPLQWELTARAEISVRHARPTCVFILKKASALGGMTMSNPRAALGEGDELPRHGMRDLGPLLVKRLRDFSSPLVLCLSSAKASSDACDRSW